MQMPRTGARILSKSDLRALLSKPTWTVNNLIDSEPLRNPPTDEDILRISQLASLEKPTPEMMKAFLNQLKFVETLRDVDTSSVEPVSRLIDTVVVPDLVSAVDSTETAPEVGDWNPVDLASEKESDYFVVKDGLHAQNNISN